MADLLSIEQSQVWHGDVIDFHHRFLRWIVFSTVELFKLYRWSSRASHDDDAISTVDSGRLPKKASSCWNAFWQTHAAGNCFCKGYVSSSSSHFAFATFDIPSSIMDCNNTNVATLLFHKGPICTLGSFVPHRSVPELRIYPVSTEASILGIRSNNRTLQWNEGFDQESTPRDNETRADYYWMCDFFILISVV